jgi:hypothetical protein
MTSATELRNHRLRRPTDLRVSPAGRRATARDRQIGSHGRPTTAGRRRRAATAIADRPPMAVPLHLDEPGRARPVLVEQPDRRRGRVLDLSPVVTAVYRTCPLV